MKKFTITEFREAYPDDDACLDKIFKLRYTNLVCPKCENDKPFTRVKERRSYQCPCCGFQLYPTQGTIFDKTTTPLTYWFYAIFLQTTTRNGVAAKELERQLSVCYKTALRMAHQIKILMANKTIEPFTGVIEMDECVVGGALKNKHNAERKALGGHKAKMVNKSVVFGMIDREEKKVFTKVVAGANRESIEPIIRENVEFASKVITDTAGIYANLNDNYYHQSVNHALSEYVRGDLHTNTIEGFWSQLKRTIKGTHIHVSERHLQKYVDEVAFRYMHKDKQDTMFETILSHVV